MRIAEPEADSVKLSPEKSLLFTVNLAAGLLVLEPSKVRSGIYGLPT